jgi:photosystem II stability/assembly factor-like uncharacterized protein
LSRPDIISLKKGQKDGPHQSAAAIAILPDDPQTIYVGTDFGVEKSIDGGATWQEVNDGLAALVPWAVAVSPDDPDTVYVKTWQDVFLSYTGGNSWQALGHRTYVAPYGTLLATDPFTGTYLYLGDECQDQFCVDVSRDGGATWAIVTATLPTAYAGWSSGSFNITPSPHTPGQILAGVSLSPPGFNDYTDLSGVFYRSDDYGASWRYITLTQTISRVTEIAYDAFDPDLIYAATAGTGLWRSTDGGEHWLLVPVANMQPPV